jgi:hypothetical protein
MKQGSLLEQLIVDKEVKRVDERKRGREAERERWRNKSPTCPVSVRRLKALVELKSILGRFEGRRSGHFTERSVLYITMQRISFSIVCFHERWYE